MTAAVSLKSVSRHFGLVRALDEVDLEVEAGEFFAMLGPSGSGKTTCLRLIAGFEQPTAGHIAIFGEAVEGVAARAALLLHHHDANRCRGGAHAAVEIYHSARQ